MNPVRLLLVEDDAVSRGFLTLALQSLPATVIDVAVDGAQALAHARAVAHDLWLLDAHLPDTRGEDLLAALRALHATVPALCLTAETDPERIAGLRAAGFTELAHKPLTIPDLHAAVRRALASAAPAAIVPVWDDAMALRALGGNTAAVDAMRGLFRAELPVQAAAIIAAIDAGQVDAAQAQLHKLKASCGFVGCPRLLAAIHALAAAPTDRQCLHAFRDQVAAADSG